MATIETNILAFSCLAIVVFLVFLYFYTKNGQRHSWPLFGMLPMLLPISTMFERVAEALESCGGTSAFQGPWFYRRSIIGTADPANMQHVLSTNFSNYPKGPETKRIFSAYGEVLFSTDLDDWRFQRKHAQAFFHHQRMQRFTVKIVKEVLEEGLIPVLDHASENGTMVDLQDVFERFMLDASFMLINGQNRSSLRVGLPEDAVLKSLHVAGKAILFRHFLPEKLWMFQRWLGIGLEKTMSEAGKILDIAAAECIRTWKDQTRNNISKSVEENFDAITFYNNVDQKEALESVGEHGYVMKEIVKVLIFGGTDTTSPVLPWFFWHLFKNPEVESMIRKELVEKIGSTTKSNIRLIFETEELNKLVYLHAAICETLRLFPTVPWQVRTSRKADMLPSGHRVKPNTRIVICSFAIGRMKSIWGGDCLEFKPERWISERGGLKPVSSNKFMAFSSGPRICLGKEMAFARLKAVAATVLFNYNIQIAEDQPAATPALSIIFHMKDGLKAKVLKRSSC